MSTIEEAAMPISIADIQAHPAEAMAALIETVRRQDGIIQELAARLDQDELHFSRQIAEDRKRLSSLEVPRITPAEKDRSDILRALLAANGGKMLAKEARKIMRLPRSRFSELLARCDFVETKPYHLDKRALVLTLKCSVEPGTILT